MNYFSECTEVPAIPHQEIVKVTEVLVNVLISRFGVPLELHSDQRRYFESAMLRHAYCFKLVVEN